MNINLAATHSFEIKKAGQILTTKTRNTTTKSNRTTLYSTHEATTTNTKKIEIYLPTTGGKAENTYIRWISLACVVLGLIGAVFAVRICMKAQS